MKEIDNPFDGEAERLIGQQNITEQQARDFVVFRYLRVGDTRALAHWLDGDYIPSEVIRRFLSYMLQPKRQTSVGSEKTAEIGSDIVPYELRAYSRDGKRGRQFDFAAAERNQQLKDLYDEKIRVIGSGGYESAIAELKDFLGPEIKESAIREAVKARSPKTGK